VLEPRGWSGPVGGVFVRRIGDETLYHIPGAAEGVLVPVGPGESTPAADARGQPVVVRQTAPSSFQVATSGKQEAVLRLRITDLPGWRATIDGRPLAFVPFAGTMIQATVPPGHHVIEFHYWPTLFTVGIIVAILTLVILATLLVVAALRRS